jgi:haloalkane dehalogenase
LPAGWEAYGVDTPKAHQDESLKFLLAHRQEENACLAEDSHQGFLPITTTEYDGLIHWQGPRDATRLRLHAPGREAALVDDSQAIRIDLPGHGLSEGWKAAAPESFAHWQAVIDAVAAHFGNGEIVHDSLPAGDPEKLYPDLSPDRFGHYLTKAWAIVRARHIFAPWYETNAANAMPIDPAKLVPSSLAIEHRALIRARAARALHIARLNNEGGS